LVFKPVIFARRGRPARLSPFVSGVGSKSALVGYGLVLAADHILNRD
jgi:hypothetical protein